VCVCACVCVCTEKEAMMAAGDVTTRGINCRIGEESVRACKRVLELARAC
jgi:hypothetical protein